MAKPKHIKLLQIIPLVIFLLTWELSVRGNFGTQLIGSLSHQENP